MVNRIPFLCFGILLSIFQFPSQAQSELDQKKAAEFFTQGTASLKIREYKSAASAFKEAASLYQNTQNWDQYFESLTQELVCYWKFGSDSDVMSQATKIEEESLGRYGANNSIQARTYNILGIFYKEKGHYDFAMKYHTNALTIWQAELGHKDYLVGHAYHNIGNVYSHKGSFDLALENYKIAFNIYIKYEKQYPSTVALSYNNQGLAYKNQGSYNLALEYFEKALSIWDTLYRGDTYEMAMAHNNIGVSYFAQGEYQNAMIHYKKSLAILNKILGNNHYLSSNGYFNLGLIYHQLDSTDLARRNFRKFINLWSGKYGDRHPRISSGLTNLGISYAKENETEKAINLYNEAIDILIEQVGNKNHSLASCYNKVGELFIQTGANIKAYDYFDKAVKANLSVNIKSNTSLAKHALDHRILLQSLHGKSRASENNNQDSALTISTSLLHLQQCDTLIDQIRKRQIKRSDKLELGKVITQVYESAIRVCLKLYRKHNDSRYLEQAFYFAEKSKNGVLTEALSNHSAKSFGFIPDSTLAFEKTLKIDLSFYQSRIQLEKARKDGYDTVQVAEWQNNLFQLNRSNDSLILSLEQGYPQYHDLKYQNNILNVSAVQNSLKKNEALIEYFIGIKDSYTFLITQKYIRVFTSVNNSDAQDEIETFRKSIVLSIDLQKDNYLKHTDMSYNLYRKYMKTIIDSIPSSINVLSIIPDGHLSYIPFDILLTDETKSSVVDYKSLPYMLKTYEINYAYSATLLFRDFNTKTLPDKELIAFAPVYNTNTSDSTRSIQYGKFRDQVTGLKWNQPEIDRITKHMDGIKLLGQDASEADFKKHVSEFNVVHLAMHALVDDIDPMNSKLIFTAEKDSIEDGLLHAHELYNMEIPAELVVLSACQTGLGKLSKGEGVMSLARAFSYAGCPSVVMSHWSVNDESTAELMDRFYKNLSEGQSKGQALRQAKLSFLEENFAPQTHPLFWGSFVVMGDTNPLKNNKNWNWFLISIVCLLAASAIIYTARRRILNSRSATSK